MKKVFIFTILLVFFSFSCGDTKSSNNNINNDINDIEDTSDTDDINNDTDSDATDLPNCDEQITEIVMIPMSDGADLSAFIKRPANSNCQMPVILIQTPYNKEYFSSVLFTTSDGSNPLFESKDYAYVVVDWRGFFGSAGAPPLSNGRTRGDDGYDIVEWIASQSWCNGNIGTWGVSAVGIIQYATAVKKPPHLKAAVPIFASLGATYEGMYPGGVLRKEYADFIYNYHGLDYTLHPLRDQFWIYFESAYNPDDIQVPMLLVAGWYDLANREMFNAFDAISSASYSPAAIYHRMLIGPWIHQSLNESTSAYYDENQLVQQESLKFFEKYLRNEDNEVTNWKKYRYLFDNSAEILETDMWPPQNTNEATFYLNTDLSLTSNLESSGQITLEYDPNDPSPTVGGQIVSPDMEHGPMDQSSILQRSDALLFQGEILTTPLTVMGTIKFYFSVAITALDADIALRLVDIYPDGTKMLITDGIRRISLRDSFATKSPVTPGEFYNVEVLLTNEVAYTFQVGHRIGFILSGSNYPRFARNPCNGENFYEDDATPIATTFSFNLDGSGFIKLFVEN